MHHFRNWCTLSVMPWKRPESVSRGQVWHRFQGKNKDGSPGQMFQVRDMESEYKDACIDLMLNAFLRDEPLCQALNILSDPIGVKTIRENWESYVSQGVSLACFTEENGNPEELVGFNVIVIRYKGEEEEDFEKMQGVGVKELFRTLQAAEELVDVYKHYGVETYLSSSGLTVHENFRGQNIGARIIEARKPLCQALNIKAVATVFTAKTSQVLAKKCGYELLATLPYEDMLQYGVDLTNCPTKTAEVRGIKFNF